MTGLLRCQMFAIISGTVAVAQQPTVDVYTNVSFDSGITTEYATAVMQVNMANIAFCQMNPYECSNAKHNYWETVTITSPGGRKSSCSVNEGNVPALDAANVQCPTQIAVGGELGNFSVQSNQNASCSIAGLFLASIWDDLNTIGESVTAYQRGGEVTGGYVYTFYPSAGACNCTCRGPNDLVIDSYSPYWQVDTIFEKVLGITFCAGSNIVNRGLSAPTTCRDEYAQQ